MNRFKKFGIGVMVVASAVAFIGCGKQSYEQRSESTVATIGEEKVKLEDIDKSLSYLINDIKKEVGDDFENNINLKIKEGTDEEKTKFKGVKDELIKYRKDNLELLMENKILSIKGRELNLITDEMRAEANKEFDAVKENFIKYQIEEGKTKEEAEVELNKEMKEFAGLLEEESDITLDEIKRKFEELTLATKMKENIIDSIVVTDEEVEKYYNDNIGDYVKPAGYEVREIFFPITDGNRDEMRDYAHDTFFEMADGNPNKTTTYDEVYSQALSAGDSQSASKKIIAQEAIITESNRNQLYLDCLKGMSEGQFCSPIETDKGFYIPYITDIREKEEVRTLEDEKEYIRSTIKYDKKNDVIKAKVLEYSQELGVKYNLDKLEF